MTDRKERLLAYIEKLTAKIEAYPDNPKRRNWEKRVAQCANSLTNERRVIGPVGTRKDGDVIIEIPTGTITVKGQGVG